MHTSRLRRLRAAALIACACALVSASLGSSQASAGSCNAGSTNFNFTLGTTNPCNSQTALTGTGPNGLFVQLTGTEANTRPVIGYASGTSGGGVIGVSGSTNSTGGYSAGVAGALNPSAPAADAAGVRGVSYSTTANGAGVWGQHQSSTGSAAGVYGQTLSTANAATGVLGVVSPATTGSYSAGVEGYNSGTNFGGFGVYGHHAGSGIGLYGEAPNGFAVSGYSPFNWAGYFQGSVNVVGTLYKSSGAFRIDNPLDPAHSYLQHSFVESPDMKNVYDGVVRTNGKGLATVPLPAWFQALNRDFRYQLTPVGDVVLVGVVREIEHNRFTIKSLKPNVKVSWQVTGIRKDPHANAHRIQTVVPKQGRSDGRYVHPELYGKPLSKSVVVLPGMAAQTRAMAQTATERTER